MPSTLTPASLFAWARRSYSGNAYWHTGQLTLKNASTTGPRCSKCCSETWWPSSVRRVKSGATIPASNAAIQQDLPLLHFLIRLHSTHRGLSRQFAQYFARESSERQLLPLLAGDPTRVSGECAEQSGGSLRHRHFVVRVGDGVAKLGQHFV